MPLTYGIDIHGTLADKQPDGTQEPSTLFPLLEPLMRAWVRTGQRVLIVSGPPREVIEEELEALGLRQDVHYYTIISVVDELRHRGVPMTEDPPGSNHWWCDDDDWNAAKGRICAKYGIKILIDDQLEYADAMPEETEFVHVTAGLLHPDLDQFKAAAAKMIGGQ